MSPPPPDGQARLQLECRGVVQGVGFRPTVHRLAVGLGLRGQVENVAAAVRLDLEGERSALEAFLRELPRRLPPQARLEPFQPLWSPPGAPVGETGPSGVRIVDGGAEPLRHRPGGAGPGGGSGPMPRLPGRTGGSRRPSPRLSLHQLLRLRPALQHRHGRALCPGPHHPGLLPPVRGLPSGVRGSGRSPLPCRDHRLPGLRTTAGAVGRGRQAAAEPGLQRRGTQRS